MIKCNMIIELASDNLFSLVSAAREVAYNYNRKEFFLFFEFTDLVACIVLDPSPTFERVSRVQS